VGVGFVLMPTLLLEGENVNERVAKIVIAVARGIAWVIEQIIKGK